MVKLNLFALGGLLLVINCSALILVNIIFGRKKVHFMWSMFNLSVAVWGLGAFMVGVSSTPERAWFWWKINHIGVIWMPVFILHTVYFLTTKVNKKILNFSYIQAICFQVIAFLPYSLFFENLRFVYSSFYYVTLGPLYHPFLILWILLVAYAHLCVYREYIASGGMKKLSLLYFIMGSILGFTGGLTNFLIGYRVDILPFGNIIIPFYSILVTYGIIKYRLMDIRVFISRAVAFLVSYFFILGVPFFFAYRLYPVLHPLIGINWWLAPATLMLFFATLAPLAYDQIKRGVEAALLAEQKKYQKLLLQAASGMVIEHDLNRLSKLVVYIVKKIVKINFVAIFLDDRETKVYRLKAIRDSGGAYGDITFLYEHPFIAYLKDKKEPVTYEELPLSIRQSLSMPLHISLIVPSLIEDNLLGFVFLGDKLNQSPYSDDDVNVFKILAHQAALAIENCFFFEEFKSVQEKIFTAEKLASIGGMADGVAHQMKNRLNHFSVASGELQCEIEDFIKKHTELVAQNPDLQKTFDYLNKIADSLIANVKRTDGVLKGILNYARVEEKETFFSYFSLKEIIDLSLDLLRVKHQITIFPLETKLNSDDTIYGVKSQIMEAIYNILDNAYEAILEKKSKLNEEEKNSFQPLIELKLAQNNTYSRIEISDNGIGIKEETKHKIFSPFFTTKSSYKSGTGIGMYVVGRIIKENHKGKIWFESSHMQGTRFFIELSKK